MRSLAVFMLVLLPIYAYNAHLERIIELKESLVLQGLSKNRVEEIFSSEKARRIDKKAVELIADMTHIKTHRKAERKANDNLLLKSALIQRHLREYKRSYDAMEETFGVDREIVAAILQKETALGSYTNYKHDAFVVLNNMLMYLSQVDDPTPRHDKRLERLLVFAKENLAALILFYEAKDLDVTKIKLPSSYAGAMGIPQFTPQHFDMINSPTWDENGTLDSMPTAIFSTAKLLKDRFEFNERIDFSKLKDLETIIERWYEFDDGTANFVYEKNLDGMKVKNFLEENKDNAQIVYIARYIKILKRYNFSTAYALGILQIAKKVHHASS